MKMGKDGQSILMRRRITHLNNTGCGRTIDGGIIGHRNEDCTEINIEIPVHILTEEPRTKATKDV